MSVRLVMILLSARGHTAGAIAEVLGCDASTVRRWIHRYNQHGIAGSCDQPRPGRPRLGSPRLTQRILRLVAKGDPGREAVLASLHQRLTELPEEAVVLAEDETHLHLLPWVRATWIAKGARQQ